MEQPVIRVVNQFTAIGTWRDLFMMRVNGRPDQATLADLDRCLTAFMAERRAEFGYLSIVPSGFRIPDRASMKSFDKILFKQGLRYRFACVVVEETGVRGGIVRAVLRMVGVHARKGHPEGLHSRVEDGVEWMHGVYGETEGDKPARKDLAEAVSSFQEQARGR